MFPKPKYMDPLKFLKNTVSLFMVMAFSPHVLYLSANIQLEKVNQQVYPFEKPLSYWDVPSEEMHIQSQQ